MPPHALRMDRPRHHTLCGPATPPHALRMDRPRHHTLCGPATPPHALRMDRPRHHALCGPATPPRSLRTDHATTLCVARQHFCGPATPPRSVWTSQSRCGGLLNGRAGIAQWLERRTRDRKIAGSNPCWSGGRIFFSRVNFLC